MRGVVQWTNSRGDSLRCYVLSIGGWSRSVEVGNAGVDGASCSTFNTKATSEIARGLLRSCLETLFHLAAVSRIGRLPAAPAVKVNQCLEESALPWKIRCLAHLHTSPLDDLLF